MTIKDWASLFVGLIGSFGWFLSWWNHREMRRRWREHEIEQRGVSGYKFRLMYRTLAVKNGWPINGEDKD